MANSGMPRATMRRSARRAGRVAARARAADEQRGAREAPPGIGKRGADRLGAAVSICDVNGDGLADIVQEPAASCEVCVEAELFGNESGDDSDFERVFEDILAVAGPEVESSHQVHEAFVQVGDSDFLAGFVAKFSDVGVHFLFGFCDHFVNPSRVNPSVLDEFDE